MRLFKKNAKGKMQFWGIQDFADDCGFETSWGSWDNDDSIQSKWHNVELNQSGRDIFEQIHLEIESKIKLKKDLGYIESLLEAQQRTTAKNQLGYPLPMLALRYEKVKRADYTDCIMQPKLNGHRCLVVNDEGTLFAYSRKGQPITTIDHILEGIRIPEGMILDGELYYHGTRFQTISSWIKCKQPETELLEYIVYDHMSSEYYPQRLVNLEKLQHDKCLGDNCKVIWNYRNKTEDDIEKIFTRQRSLGYEGLIVRLDGQGYQSGKRPKYLIKVKTELDFEFKVIGIKPSADGWARLTCEIVGSEATEFNISAPGTIEEKEFVLDHPEKFIGKWIKVEFAEYTKSGKPFHCVATDWIDPEDIDH